MNRSRPPAVPGPVDLVTGDLGAACAFYGALLGWAFGDTTDRVTASTGGTTAATLRSGDGPARWWTTFTVADVAAAGAAATGAGARLDGSDVHDPFGVFFRIGPDAAAAAPGPGRPCWYEYMTTAAGDADAFHAEALSLRPTVPEGAPDDSYVLLVAGDRPVAGRLAIHPPLAGTLATGWMVYFGVADPDAVAEQAERLGGRLLVPPRDVATGRVAALADPAGAVFTVIRPAA